MYCSSNMIIDPIFKFSIGADLVGLTTILVGTLRLALVGIFETKNKLL